MTELRFNGELPLWLAIALALVGGLAAFLLYRRELRSGWAGWLLPTLRALAVVLILMMLAGPELAHVTGEDYRGRVLVLVDSSQSMGVADWQMPLNEKLVLADRLGLIEVSGDQAAWIEAAGKLTSASAIASDSASWNADPAGSAARFAEQLAAAKTALDQADGELALRLQNELVGPAEQLKDRAADRSPRLVVATGQRIADRLPDWQEQLADRLDRQTEARLAGQGAGGELAQLDEMTRWQRIEHLLLDLDDGALSQVAQDSDVTLITLAGGDGENTVVSSADPQGLPDELPGRPEAGVTDLASELERIFAEQGGTDRLAVVLVSDGRQNQGPSLVEAALRARSAGVPIHTVAVGTTRMPHDLAVADVTHPPTVLADGRIVGTIKLIDAMPAGQRFSVQIVSGQTVLWERTHMTGGAQGGAGRVQELEYAFDAKQAVETAEQETPEGLILNQLPIPMQVRLVGLEGDTQPKNDSMDFQVRSVQGERKMLILAGRPRWEMRYLDAMFSRDPRWEVTTLFASTGDGKPWPRGDEGGAFPQTRDALMAYDIIVLGELRPGTLSDGELGWLYEFVANRAGGMIVIDGRRGDLANYARSPIGPLLPRRSNDRGRRPRLLELTAVGRTSPATLLEIDTERNLKLWAELEPPSYIAPVTPTPGVDTVLVQARVSQNSNEAWPAILSRRVGAGWVWYSAVDETWRWRRDHESLYQQKYWHQVTNRVIEPLYAAEDRFVSLGVDQAVVESGSSLPVRVRLRDDRGRPRTTADASVYLSTLEGKRVMEASLTPDAAEGGRFTADLEPRLAPGVYRVGVRVDGLSDTDILAKTLITVRGNTETSGELADVTLNLPLLLQASGSSLGRTLREYEMDQLPELLEELSESSRQETVTKLWQSWPWFLSVVGLLALEFGLRRRLGML